MKKKMKTRAEIILHNSDAKDLLDEVFSTYIKSGTRKTKEGKDVTWKTKVIFLIDPCVHLNWYPLIDDICKRANREEGIEIIMNWNFSAIGRNISNPQLPRILSEIYGIPEVDVIHEFSKGFTIGDYLDKYKAKLGQYFAYVNEVGVPRKRTIKPKMSNYREYFLIHCSNNASANSLSSSKIKELGRKIVQHSDILKWAGN